MANEFKLSYTAADINEKLGKIDSLDLAIKTDKAEVDAKLTTKIDRSEIEEIDAVELVAELGLVSPVAAEDDSIYTDENGALYSL